MSTTVITLVLLQNCIDSRSSELGSHSALCATSSEFGNELIRVQVEGITEMTVGGFHEVMTSLITDPGVDFMSVDHLACFIVIQICMAQYNFVIVNTLATGYGDFRTSVAKFSRRATEISVFPFGWLEEGVGFVMC